MIALLDTVALVAAGKEAGRAAEETVEAEASIRTATTDPDAEPCVVPAPENVEVVVASSQRYGLMMFILR